MAKSLCEEHNLLSPIYHMSTRGGCWFCPNVRLDVLRQFRQSHPDLWQEYEALAQTPNLCSDGVRFGMTMTQLVNKLDMRDQQLKIKQVETSTEKTL